jgi:hypothetical protein
MSAGVAAGNSGRHRWVRLVPAQSPESDLPTSGADRPGPLVPESWTGVGLKSHRDPARPGHLGR